MAQAEALRRFLAYLLRGMAHRPPVKVLGGIEDDWRAVGNDLRKAMASPDVVPPK